MKTDNGAKTETLTIESEPSLKTFVEAYLAAANVRDFAALKAMCHPKDLAACESFVLHKPAAFDKLTLENMISPQSPVPPDHQPFLVKRYLANSPLPQAGFVVWPVRPTHEVQCSYQNGPNNIGSFVIELTRENNRWFAVHGVPDPEFTKKMTGGGR